MHYAWGEKASDKDGALIPKILNIPAGDEPWAELWIGAHPQASSVVAKTGKPLYEAIAENPREMIGEKEGTLPFLLKILCCSNVLSIQSHPDRQTAKRLHRLMPENFPDENHKPEMIYALSNFEMMAGFRDIDDILADLSQFKSLAPWKKSLPSIPFLRDICSALMQFDKAALDKMATNFIAETSRRAGRFALFRRLFKQYPGDSGVFFSLILNYMTLKPCQAVYIGSNMPHAYIKGRGIECMANSNNVIRAGLTPKYVNRDLLLNTLDFKSVSPKDLTMTPKDRFTNFNCGDFALCVLRLRGDDDSCMMPGGFPAVLVVVEGDVELKYKNKKVKAERGSAWFVPHSLNFMDCTISSKKPAVVAIAGIDIFHE